MTHVQKRFEKHLPEGVKKQLSGSAYFKRRLLSAPRLYMAAHIAGYEKEKDSRMQCENAEAAKSLESQFRVFLPQRDNPYGTLKVNSQGFEMALVDAKAIKKSIIIFAVGGFAKDTSWECGYATDKRKFSVLMLPGEKAVKYHIEDWMLLLSFDSVLVPQGLGAGLQLSPACPPDLKIVEYSPAQDIGELVLVLYKAWRLPKFIRKLLEFVTKAAEKIGGG